MEPRAARGSWPWRGHSSFSPLAPGSWRRDLQPRSQEEADGILHEAEGLALLQWDDDGGPLVQGVREALGLSERLDGEGRGEVLALGGHDVNGSVNQILPLGFISARTAVPPSPTAADASAATAPGAPSSPSARPRQRPASAPAARGTGPRRRLSATGGGPDGDAAAESNVDDIAADRARLLRRKSHSPLWLGPGPPPKDYLRKYRLKEEAKGRELKARASRLDGATLYRHLMHMGEANALAEELGSSTRFRPHRSETVKGGVVCHIYENEQLSKEVGLGLFERRYAALQARWNQLTGIKAVHKPMSAQSASRPTGPTSLSPEAQEELQQQIQQVTTETLALADRMRQQLRVLERDSERTIPVVTQ